MSSGTLWPILQGMKKKATLLGYTQTGDCCRGLNLKLIGMELALIGASGRRWRLRRYLFEVQNCEKPFLS